MNASIAHLQREPCHRLLSIFIAAVAAGVLHGCAQLERTPEPSPPQPVPDVSPSVPSSPGAGAKAKQEHGRVSMYGKEFQGRKTASGQTFDPTALTMAHRTLPFGTRVRVTNLETQRSVEVVVNDRGPFVAGRVADLSEAAARRLGMIADGVVEALLDIVQATGGR